MIVNADSSTPKHNTHSSLYTLNEKGLQYPRERLRLCMLSHVCDPIIYSPPGSSVHGIFQARILEWVAISSSREAFPPRDRTCISGTSCLVRWILSQLSYQGSPKLICPGGGNGNPLQYSCLENSMYRGAWRATVHGVAQSQIGRAHV